MKIFSLSTSTRRLVAGALAAALIGVGGAGASAGATPNNSGFNQVVEANEVIIPKGTPVVIEEGHVDIGPRIIDDTLVLLFRDDTAVPPVWRYLEDAVFQLDQDAENVLPDGKDYDFTGATSGHTVWAVPQNQVAGVPWIGWSTQDPGLGDVFTRGMTFNFGPHTGPGQASMFLQSGGFGGPQVLFTSTEGSPQSIFVDLNTHTHLNWVFTSPGVHTVAVTVTGETPTGQQAAATGTLVFAVGDTSTSSARSAAVASTGSALGGLAGAQAAPPVSTSSASATDDAAQATSSAREEPQETTTTTSPDAALAADQATPVPTPLPATAPPASTSTSGVSATTWLVFFGLIGVALVLLVAAIVIRRRRAADAVFTGGTTDGGAQQ